MPTDRSRIRQHARTRATARHPEWDVGRHVFGAAMVAFGLVALAWPASNDWLHLAFLGKAPASRVFVYAAGAAQILGGAAIEFRRTAKMGAILIGGLYVGVALLCVPQIVATPKVYVRWGDFFEHVSIAAGAAIVYARNSDRLAPRKLARIGSVLFGACTASFALEQAIYLSATAQLVPAWLPPSQTCWAAATTVAFALAAVALLTGRSALLATRLLTTMLVLFGFLVWLPLLRSDPHSQTNWSETVETFAIAGVAWMLADLLGQARPANRRLR